MMRKATRGLAMALIGLTLSALSACATYRDDLDRATAHYHSREYEKALVLLAVLESDIDSLSPQERAQYCYYRGMSFYLVEQRNHARHWLGRAAAREKNYAGALNPDETKKVDETLADLNKDRWGGADTPSANKTCDLDTDCGDGQFCDNSQCTDAPGKQPSAVDPSSSGPGPAKAPKGGCSSDADCPGTEICDGTKCKAP
jgi:hypothetical protein